jgi:hypothetical protein
LQKLNSKGPKTKVVCPLKQILVCPSQRRELLALVKAWATMIHAYLGRIEPKSMSIIYLDRTVARTPWPNKTTPEPTPKP